MEATKATGGEGWGRRVRAALGAAVVVLTALLLYQARDPGEGSRFGVRSAYADSIAAAPGFIALTLPSSGGGAITAGGGAAGGGGGGALKFFLIDTNKRVVCVYNLSNDKIRLVSAREYDRDMDIVDASQDVPLGGGRGIKSFEGGIGLNRVEAEAYADGLKKWLEEAEKKSK